MTQRDIGGPSTALRSAQDDSDLERLAPRLADPLWRMANLYWVKPKKGPAVLFAPRPGQWKVIRAIYVLGILRMIIPKARQLGISTVIALIILDMMLFKDGWQSAIVDLTQADASKKLRGKILFAFDRLPPFLRRCYEVLDRSGKSFSIRLRGRESDSWRQVQAGMNARGDTFQFLHISEWGKIAFEDPARSEEIETGAMPAAESGIIVVETTWKGGKVGHLWDLTKEAMETPESYRTEKDFTVFFCPWWEEPIYTMAGDVRQIASECREYLDEVEAEIRERGPDGKGPMEVGTRKGEGGSKKAEPFAFTPGQRLWYYKEAWKKGLFRFQEYPSILSECFRAPIEGAIYAALLDKLRGAGRIGAIKSNPDAKVNTCWDLGGPRNIVVWYFQLIGEEIRILDCDTDLDLTAWERVEHMTMKAAANGWTWGFHFLPHDAAAKEHQGKTTEADLRAAGLTNTRIVPRTADVWIGINHVRSMMPRMTFRAPDCDEGLNRLEAYHVGVWIEKGRQMDLPVHDKSSHAADGLRTMGEADLAGMLQGGWERSPFNAAGLQALAGK
jgi:hypothetical protein